MKIKTEIYPDGSIVCETDCDTRHYRSRYNGYTLKQAKAAFKERVLSAEQEALDRTRLLALAQYLKVKEKGI